MTKLTGTEYLAKVQAERLNPVKDAIRAAYRSLAGTDWCGGVGLADLRGRLTYWDREDVDQALESLSRDAGVHLFPESKQGLLTADQRAAAIIIGNQPNHLIVID